jgi:hypothetical protein
MRMRMVSPFILCRAHLLGEHWELHKHHSRWAVKRQSVTGYLEANAMEPQAYGDRHDALVAEMAARGYHHNSPLTQPDFSYLSQAEREYRIDMGRALRELLADCPECRRRYLDWTRGTI